MKILFFPHRLAALALLPAALAACNDSGTTPVTAQAHAEVIVNSMDNSVTLLSPDSTGADAVTVGLGPQGSPVGAAVRGTNAIVPLGTYPFAAVVDLRSKSVARTVALPANSGATGAAFLNDSVAFVANSNLNSVSPVNVRTGAVGAPVAVGTYPQAIVAGNGAVYVLNANLVHFAPAGPGSVTVINSAGQAAGTIALTGINPTAGVVSGSRLYVINAGHYGQGDGSLSVVNLATGHEDLNVAGFGEFPGSIDVGPDGNVYVAVYGLGVVEWSPASRTFVRGLNNPIVPGGTAPVAAVAFDYAGRLHTVNPLDCSGPGKEYRLGTNLAVERTVSTGVCPFSIAFTDYTAS